MSFEPAKSQLMSVSLLPEQGRSERQPAQAAGGSLRQQAELWIPYPSNGHTRNPTPPFGGTVYSGSCRCLHGVCQTSDGVQPTCVAWRGSHTPQQAR